MPRKKLKRFDDIKITKSIIEIDHQIKNNIKKPDWKKLFGNSNDIIIELACGRAEYSIYLAKKFPDKNFIAIDVKGIRLWQANKQKELNNLSNIIFLRSQIQFIDEIFDKKSVTQIWIIHPDPQLKKAKKRLTSPAFLDKYKKILKKDSSVYLRTDNKVLFEYSKVQILNQKGIINFQTNNLTKESTRIKDSFYTETKYGNLAIQNGLSIYFLEFSFDN